MLLAVLYFGPPLQASQTLDQARKLLNAGDTTGARTLLAAAARSNPGDITALTEYAEFLDRFGDPACRAAYGKLLDGLERSGDPARRASVAGRLAALDLLAGDRAAASRHLDIQRQAGGTGLSLPAPKAAAAPASKPTISIPGPLRSFGRMAAISTDIGVDEVLPAIARNVVTNGYQASHSNDALEQTEYLKLVFRYLSQARELDRLSGAGKVIRIDNCESPTAGDLLKILGYRMRGGCGSEVVLETVNASRAFLSTDSGFPLAELEQALRTNRPFVHDYQPTAVPVLYSAEYWTSAKEKASGEFIDIFLSDPSLCRLYLGFSKLDSATAEELRKGIAVQRIKAFAHVLDFFGGMFEIRNGKAVTPGGPRATAMWTELVGASPDQGAAFFEKLIAKDDGWLASLFDALLRIQGPTLEYLTEPLRMKRFYQAVRGRVTSPGPARPVFRSNSDMMLLTTRLRVGPNGKPHIPGSIETWKTLFVSHPHGKYDGRLTKLAASWKEPDDVIEALFALCRKAVENEPLKIFMAISDLDRRRARPLEPATVERMARDYRLYGQQYAIFNDAPSVTDKTILQFLDSAVAVVKMKDAPHRADTAGTLQALIGLWQIFSRQGSLPQSKADETLAGILDSFAKVSSDRDIFDGGRAGVKRLLAAVGSTKEDVSPHERLIDLLAGAANPTDRESHNLLVQEMIRILEAQRIIPLGVLFDLADHLESLSRGEKLNTALVNRLASRIAEIQLPRSALTGVEKNAFAFGYWTEKHVEAQRKLNMRAVVERAAGDAEKLKAARGLLTAFLRDTLVAMNYAHYAPPGAQVLYTNPLFVRGHDFLGVQGSNHTWRSTELFGTGWPSNGGGRLVGSLAGLPYALAEAEQNFLVPSQTQALIWGDLVPQMILSAKIPRWWNVTPAQMHWLGLHMRYGQSLLAEAALGGGRQEALETLAGQAPPARVRTVERFLNEGDMKSALDQVTPSELFALAVQTLKRGAAGGSVLAAEIRRLAAEAPDQVNYEAISRAFGTPKPTLANSYQPELLGLRTFPTLMGYSSRIMAESWESNTLYWAALADEVHLPPSQLNLLIPEWTQKVVERIFASHLEDWPALLRSLRIVGDDVRTKARRQLEANAGL
ncbi:MAG: hypothetical protein HYR60_03060 [Acidobacteria bacterium]|nr:hypothetical protein [Acidobacteriota bacterium]